MQTGDQIVLQEVTLLRIHLLLLRIHSVILRIHIAGGCPVTVLIVCIHTLVHIQAVHICFFRILGIEILILLFRFSSEGPAVILLFHGAQLFFVFFSVFD